MLTRSCVSQPTVSRTFMRPNQKMVTTKRRLATRTKTRVLHRKNGTFSTIITTTFATYIARSILASLTKNNFLLTRAASNRGHLFSFFYRAPQRGMTAGRLRFFPVRTGFNSAIRRFRIKLNSITMPKALTKLLAIRRHLKQLPLRAIITPTRR